MESSPMPVPVVRFLAIVELEGDLKDSEYLFRRFQEDVESAFARMVARATLTDLEDFAPDIVVPGQGRVDGEVPPVAGHA
jgi:hypothetical protein